MYSSKSSKSSYSKRNERKNIPPPEKKQNKDLNKSSSVSKVKEITAISIKETIPSYTKRSLSKDQLDLLYNEYSLNIHQKYKKLQQKHPTKNFEKEKYIELKRCEECSDFLNDTLLLLCDVCEDAYHIYCLNPPLKNVPPEKETFICNRCKEQYPIRLSTNRQTIVMEYFAPVNQLQGQVQVNTEKVKNENKLV